MVSRNAVPFDNSAKPRRFLKTYEVSHGRTNVQTAEMLFFRKNARRDKLFLKKIHFDVRKDIKW